MGGQFRQILMTMGKYDLITLYEAPDDTVATASPRCWARPAMFERTTSRKGFSDEAFRPINQSVP